MVNKTKNGTWAEEEKITDFHVNEVPGTNVLGIVVFSVTLGLIIGAMGASGNLLRLVIHQLQDAIIQMVKIVIWYVQRTGTYGPCDSNIRSMSGADVSPRSRFTPYVSSRPHNLPQRLYSFKLLYTFFPGILPLVLPFFSPPRSWPWMTPRKRSCSWPGTCCAS